MMYLRAGIASVGDHQMEWIHQCYSWMALTSLIRKLASLLQIGSYLLNLKINTIYILTMAECWNISMKET